MQSISGYIAFCDSAIIPEAASSRSIFRSCGIRLHRCGRDVLEDAAQIRLTRPAVAREAEARQPGRAVAGGRKGCGPSNVARRRVERRELVGEARAAHRAVARDSNPTVVR